jgi:hypothetical protein
MGAAFTLFDLAGAVALLTCGLHMVQTGITRAYGLQLRRMHQRWKLVRIRSGEPQTPVCRVALDRCEPARLNLQLRRMLSYALGNQHHRLS